MAGSPTKRRVTRRPLEKAGTVGLAVVATATAALLLLLVCTASLRYNAAVDYALAAPRKLWSRGVSIAAEASPSPEKGHGAGAPAMAAEEEEECDLFDGSWVWDDSYPLYDSKDCPFLDGGFRCSENGRPDASYVKWRWQPSRCDLPSDSKMMNGVMASKAAQVWCDGSLQRWTTPSGTSCTPSASLRGGTSDCVCDLVSTASSGCRSGPAGAAQEEAAI